MKTEYFFFLPRNTGEKIITLDKFYLISMDHAL